jgi:glutamate/tyrosine decarboxylase-like PLP-dependent enzyme
MHKPPWRSDLEPAIEAALGFLEGLPERPVRAGATAEELLSAFAEPLADDGIDARSVLRELARKADAGLTAMPSGRFFGWVIGGALPAALGADWLVAAWDQNTGMAEPTPAAAAIEQVVLRDIVELLDLPRQCSGALVTGAQMASTTCLAAARGRVLRARGWDVEEDGLLGAPALHVVVGAERHDAIMRALRLLGLGTACALTVPVDDQGRMLPDALRAVLSPLTGSVIVCAQAGNVNSGSVDPLPEICDTVDGARARLGASAVWLHIDGAFGLWARASRRLAPLVAGAERADSWATDAHKWLNTPYDCGIALCADPEAHRRAMTVRAAYLPDQDTSRVRSPLDFTPEFSRRARGFPVYAALRQLGRRGVERLIEGSCAHARRFADELSREEGVVVLNDVVLNQVVVGFRDPRGGDDDAHTRRVVARVQDEGTCFMSGSTWCGRGVMRISVSNWSTDDGDVSRSIASVLAAHRG